MLKHNGGDRVGKDILNLTNGERIDIRDEGILLGCQEGILQMPGSHHSGRTGAWAYVCGVSAFIG